MSLPGRRLAATLVALMGCVFASLGVQSASLPDSTWVALPSLPAAGHDAVYAFAVSPGNNQALIAGNSQGSLFRSTDGGSTWKSVYAGHKALRTIAFDPTIPEIVLAGTVAGGALASSDGGVTWKAATGLEGRDVNVFGFALNIFAAGTDKGVYVSDNSGLSWTSSGMTAGKINALAVAAIHDPVRLIAGGESTSSGAQVPLFQSIDGGATWTAMNPTITGLIVARIAAGPLPPGGAIRPLIVGTSAGLFTSPDNGATFSLLSGTDVLPTIDYTQVGFVTSHHDRYYVASDGSGSQHGGLWWTGDAGQHFSSLVPPVASITALAVSNDEQPYIYVAAFGPTGHGVSIWAYHDTGGPAQVPSTATPARLNPTPSPNQPNAFAGLVRMLSASQAPYIGLGIVALAVLLLAAVSHFRSRVR